MANIEFDYGWARSHQAIPGPDERVCEHCQRILPVNDPCPCRTPKIDVVDNIPLFNGTLPPGQN